MQAGCSDGNYYFVILLLQYFFNYILLRAFTMNLEKSNTDTLGGAPPLFTPAAPKSGSGVSVINIVY
jgi:hypothetical protein